MTNQISSKYRDLVKTFDEAVRRAVSVSQEYEGLADLPYFQYYSSILFTTICTRAISLASIVPHSTVSGSDLEHWDYASVGGLARSLLEARLLFFYLCIDECSDAERELRFHVFQLHDSCSREKLFSNMPDGAGQVGCFSEKSTEIKSWIENNSYYINMNAANKKSIRNGKVAYIYPLEMIANRVGIPLEDFRTYYQMMSSYTHNFPLAFMRMEQQVRGRGTYSEVEEGYIVMFVSLAKDLLIESTNEYERQFN